MATDRQKAHALISRFLASYKKKFGAAPPAFNRHALSHGFESLVLDYPQHAERIVDYYIDNYDSPAPVWLTYNYGKVLEEILASEEDEANRRKIRKLTIERMKNVTDRRQGS